jgi:Tol biopolymer transport system component
VKNDCRNAGGNVRWCGLLLALSLAPGAWAHGFSEWSTPQNLGSVVNTESTDGCPFLSKDGLSLYFASNRPGAAGGNDLYVSERETTRGPWGPAVNLGPDINSAANELCPTLSLDGRLLFLVSDRPGGCGGQDLYVSWRYDKQDELGWQAPVNLGCDVNSSAHDFTPSFIEHDRTGSATLYFSSSRSGGPGGTDIYASAIGAGGAFGSPHLVEGVNTEFNDQRPNVHPDGREIFFDSDRPGTLGMMDLWVSRRARPSDPWSEPENLESLNTDAVEGRPVISFHGKELYFMSSRAGGFGGIDLYVARRRRWRTE